MTCAGEACLVLPEHLEETSLSRKLSSTCLFPEPSHDILPSKSRDFELSASFDFVCSAVASNRPTEALASEISFTFVVYSHYKHSYYLGRELNHGPIASVISLPSTLPQS